MKAFSFALIMLSFLFQGTQVSAQNNVKECECKINRVKTVSFTKTDNTANPANSNSSWLDTPIASTTFKAKRGCVIVDFSALGRPLDGHIVFQLRLDGVPMVGHGVKYLTSDISDPIVSDPDETGKLGFFRMISYHFFSEIKKCGEHTLELFWSGCCSAKNASGATLVNPTFAISFRK